MTDLTLGPDDRQELGDAIDKAVVAGELDENLKDAFCGCWPTVKRLLEWVQRLPVSQKIKEAIKTIIDWGDFLHGKLCADWRPEA